MDSDISQAPHTTPEATGLSKDKSKPQKKVMKKSKAALADPLITLLCLTATPIDNKLPSPAELLFGRPIQDNLPRKMADDPTNEEVTNRLIQKQVTQKYYHDRNTRPLPVLNPGQHVNIQDPKTQKWEPAEIKKKIQEVPRSYIIVKLE